jgi:Uma2 family endonuclease
MSDAVGATEATAQAENGAVDNLQSLVITELDTSHIKVDDNSDLESVIITELDTSHIEVDDGKPVDNFISEKEMRLLPDSLYTSWKGPGDHRPFLVCADVGLYYALHSPPYVPDVMVSVDVRHRSEFKTNRAYFVWEYGKVPDIVIEIVSNREGGELTNKLQGYARLGIPYYIVHDPGRFLGDQELYVFELHVGEYVPATQWRFPHYNLGVCLWQGQFEDVEMNWLRWCDAEGNILPTGAEAAAIAQRQAEQERNRAEQEHHRAELLAERLRALGVDPDQIGD